MTSDGPYPPGNEPGNGGPPYGRYPDEPAPDAPPGRASASARVSPPGEWGPPAARDQAGTAQYEFDQQSREQFGRGQQVGPPPGYAAAGQFGAAPAEPPRQPGQPSDAPLRGQQPPGVYGAPTGQFGSTQYGAPTSPAGPTQYGNATQYGGAGGQYGTPPREPDQYGTPTQYSGAGGQYAPPGQYGSGQGQYGQPSQPGQYGTPGQYGQPDQYGTPGQYGSGQYGSGQYGPGQGRYDDPEATRLGPAYGDGQPADGDESPQRSRRGLIIGLVIAGVVVLVLAAVGIVASMSGGGGSDYAVGSCVKQSGDKATSVSCSDSGAFSITSKVDAPAKCSDQTQPYVILHRSGSADQVLCLKPAS